MAGQLWGWGSNYFAQLGDNTTVRKSSPIQTIAGGTNWSSVSCGYAHTAAIKTDGTLWAWGSNSYNATGELGDNTTIDKSSPVQTIAGGTNWSSVACGYRYTAAIKTDGTLWTWGYNLYGALGDNTTVRKSSPIQTIAGGTNWNFVACGNYHTAAIKTDGTLWLWGSGTSGQLGDATIVSKSSPVQTVTGGTNWSQVEGGFIHVAAIKTDGTLWTWGNNNFGQLGDNTTTSRSSPIQTIAGGTNWESVYCGKFFTAAIKTDGTLWTWGSNSYGQLGDNTSVIKSSPVQTIAGGTNWSSVACGNDHTAAIKTDGTLWTWGYNYFGQLGDNTVTHRSSPIQTIAGGNRWSLSAGYVSTFAIYENAANQLGINTQPQVGYNSNQLLVQPKININDSVGSVVRIATNSVSVAVQSGTATLSGTTTVTAVDGIATFTDLVLTGSGNVTLRFTSSGLTLVDSSSFTVSLTLPIIPKRSEVSNNIPTSSQLNIGELAINIDDKKGFIKKSDGTVLNIFNGKVADGGSF
jgi:alpha-tubulin suppressor-like RCC1 family protein